MHAYLFIGTQISSNQEQVSKLANKLNAKIMEFPLVKIEDVRNLNNLIRLKFNEPTLIYCPDIHNAGEEALNALLKNLEEPQENIFFALTAPSAKKVLSTIVSRCQIIKVLSTKYSVLSEDVIKFMTLPLGEKLSYVDKFKDRNLAIEFAEKLAFFVHGSLSGKEVKYRFKASDGEAILKTLSRLNANGNVNLQLSNLVIQLSNNAK